MKSSVLPPVYPALISLCTVPDIIGILTFLVSNLVLKVLKDNEDKVGLLWILMWNRSKYILLKLINTL